jgi:tetratricopeptide (TPR) repeat protein
LLRDRPNDPNLLHALGAALTVKGQTVEARSTLNKALKLRPGDADILRDLAATYKREGRFGEAIRILDRALKLQPRDPILLGSKAECLFTTGEIDRAFDTLKPALEAGVVHISLALGLARIASRVKEEPQAIALLEQCLDRHELPPIVRADALFQLGDLLDRVGQYDRAFEVFVQANQQRQVPFDPKLFSQSIDELIRTWTSMRIRQLPHCKIRSGGGAGATSEGPVFIVGMPRSGTSLVEQILASHPQVHGAGELNNIPKLVHDWQGDLSGVVSVMTDLEPLTQQAVDDEARKYLDQIRRLAPRAARVTDKMPLNFLHLGLISLLFHNAVVIHCVRDPLDTCLSCFFHNFGGNNPFAYDLTHLGHFYRDYQRIMRHWREVLDIPMLDVVYEDLVMEQEAVSRRMVEFIGLDWNEACLQFHENKRVVLTMSNDQVRRPMYNSSVGRWRKHEKHLSPLKEALGGT